MCRIDRNYIFILILLLIIAHFVPFERSSIAADDYFYLAQSRSFSGSQLISKMAVITDRPLNFILLMAQGRFVGDNAKAAFLLLLFSAGLLLMSAFFLFKQFLSDSKTAFLAAVIFCLLPGQLEIFHTLIFFNINMAISIYMASFAFFVQFLKQYRKPYLIISVVLYTIGIFWYEVGFFMPFATLFYIVYFKKKKDAKFVLSFLVFSGIYLLFRFLPLSRQDVITQHSFSLTGFLPAFKELFHHYLGRYMIRNVVYGLYNFASMEQPWLSLAVIFDIAAVVFIGSFINKNKSFVPFDRKQYFFAVLLIFIFILPMFLGSGGIGGRHLVLPSLGVSIIFVGFLIKIECLKKAFPAVVLVGLLISQGNTWSQVLACRLNAAVYETINEKASQLKSADNVVIDLRSFADNIPFTMVDRDFNLLNTYYGAQAFEDRGFKAMVSIATNEFIKDKTFVAITSPQFNEQGDLEFNVFQDEGYRRKAKTRCVIPADNSLVIDFTTVFKGNFNKGKR